MKTYNFHLVLIATMIISCSGESIWDGIVDKVTDAAYNLGFPHAGKRCAVAIGESCVYSDGRGNLVHAPFYECKMDIGIMFLDIELGKGTCQMRSWFVVVVLALAVVSVLALLGCVCQCIGGGR